MKRRKFQQVATPLRHRFSVSSARITSALVLRSWARELTGSSAEPTGANVITLSQAATRPLSLARKSATAYADTKVQEPASAQLGAREQATSHARTRRQGPLAARAEPRLRVVAQAQTRELVTRALAAGPDPMHALKLGRAQNTSIEGKRATRRWTFLWLPSFACLGLCADALVRHRDLLRADLLANLAELLPAALGVLVVAAMATFLALGPSPGKRRRCALAVRFSALSAGPLSVLPVLVLLADDSASPAPEALHPWGLPCFFLAYLIAGSSLAALAWELRRTASAFSSWQAVALGSAAAAWSALALLIHCPGAEPTHLLAGHVLPICLLPLLGLALQRALRLI